MADPKLEKRIKTLLRRYINSVDVGQQRAFNRVLDAGGIPTESRYDNIKDKNKEKKLSSRAKKIERQLDSAYDKKRIQEEASKKAEEDAKDRARRKDKATKISPKRKLKTLSSRGRGGGGGLFSPTQTLRNQSLLSMTKKNQV